MLLRQVPPALTLSLALVATGPAAALAQPRPAAPQPAPPAAAKPALAAQPASPAAARPTPPAAKPASPAAAPPAPPVAPPAPPAAAQPAPPTAPPAPPTPDAEAAARQLGDEGLRRFNIAQWAEAYNLFQSADKALHAPTLVLYMAHCQLRLGNLIAARRLYRIVTAERLLEDAPIQFLTAQTVAREELRALRKRIFVVKISIAGVPVEKARVLVDGVEVPAAEVGDLALEPGSHVVEASIAGSPPVRKPIEATAGGTAEIVLLSPGAPAPQRAHVPAPVKPKPAPPPPRPRSLLAPAGIALGLGGGALVAGAITGGLSLGAAGDVKSRCRADGHCLASDQPNAVHSGRLADASTILFIAGGAVLTTGVILTAVHAHNRKKAAAGAPALHLNVGLGHGAFGGSF